MYGSERELPKYDDGRRELLLGETVIKRFRQPAADQEMILLAFEESSWSEKIDDPLSPKVGIDPKDRLRNVIKNLNRNQRVSLLRFRGDGTGTGVLWEKRRLDGNRENDLERC